MACYLLLLRPHFTLIKDLLGKEFHDASSYSLWELLDKYLIRFFRLIMSRSGSSEHQELKGICKVCLFLYLLVLIKVSLCTNVVVILIVYTLCLSLSTYSPWPEVICFLF